MPEWGEVTRCALHSPPESLERRGPGHPGFLQAGPVASLHRVGGSVHGAAIQVALCVGVATMPDTASGPARCIAATSCPGRWRRWWQGGRRRWLQRALGLGRGRRWRWRQVVMGVQEAVLGLPEWVLVVLLVPPEVLGWFERGRASTVAALSTACRSRHAAALRLHPARRLCAPLPSRFTALARAPPRCCCRCRCRFWRRAEAGLSFPLEATRGSEARGDREGALLAGGITDHDKAPFRVVVVETRSWSPQVTKTRACSTPFRQWSVPPSSLSSSLPSFGCRLRGQELLAARAEQ